MYSGSRVEIDVENMKAEDFKTSNIADEISSLTGIRVTTVGLELNNDGFVVRIVVPIEKEEEGESIVTAVNTLNKESKSCNKDERALCRSKVARIITDSQQLIVSLSGASSIHVKSTVITVIIGYVIMMMMPRLMMIIVDH